VDHQRAAEEDPGRDRRERVDAARARAERLAAVRAQRFAEPAAAPLLQRITTISTIAARTNRM
jgi:hypothetical protein